MTRPELYKKGYTDKEISDMLNLPLHTVTSWRWRAGLEPNKKPTIKKETPIPRYVDIFSKPQQERQLVIDFIKELFSAQDKAETVLGRKLNKQELFNLVNEAFK